MGEILNFEPRKDGINRVSIYDCAVTVNGVICNPGSTGAMTITLQSFLIPQEEE